METLVFFINVGIGKESKEIYLVLSEKNRMEDYTSGRQEISNCFSSDKIFKCYKSENSGWNK